MNGNNILAVFIWMLIAASFLTVVTTAFVPGFESALKTMTKENGFFEWMSVVLLLTIMVYGFRFVHKYHSAVPKWALVFIAGFSVLGFLAAMEEISWGQQVFGFHSTEYFIEHNYQKETNLHNFIPAEIFSSIIYSSVYAFFVFFPLIARFLAPHSTLLQRITPYVPQLPIVLIVLYGSAFQAYFYNDFGAWFDMGTLGMGIILTGLYILVRRREVAGGIKVAYVLLVAAIGIFMLSYKAFGFFNMQYEIREMFVDLAALMYFIQLTKTLLPSK